MKMVKINDLIQTCGTLNTLVDFISVFKLNSQYDNHQMQQVQLQSEQFNPRRFQSEQ